MNNQKQHLRLTSLEVKENWQQGDYTASGYLYHLFKALKKEGWSFRIENVADFCKTWEISEASFYRAKAKLITQGRLSEKILGKIELKLTEKVVTLNSESPAINSESPALNSESPAINSESPAINSESPAINSENAAGVKPFCSKGYSNSPTLIRSITDLYPSLSQEERESFKHFCLEKAQSLPKPPDLPEAWAKSQIEELYSQWQSGIFSSSAAADDDDCALPPDWVPAPHPSFRTDSIDEETYTEQEVGV